MVHQNDHPPVATRREGSHRAVQAFAAPVFVRKRRTISFRKATRFSPESSEWANWASCAMLSCSPALALGRRPSARAVAASTRTPAAALPLVCVRTRSRRPGPSRILRYSDICT